jgi:transglutaminase-like putative cysteine protease
MASSTARRPQLTFEELQQLKWLLGGTLTLLALWTVFYMDIEAWTLMGLATLATVLSLAWPTLPSRLPGWVHTAAFPAIVAFFAADLWLFTEVLPAMVRLDILLLLYRNIGYRQRRDDLQVVILGLFLIVVAGVLTVSLAFAAQILIYTGIALAFLLTITLSDAAAAVRPATVPAAEGPPAWAVQVRWRHLFRRLAQVGDWRVVATGGLLFIGVVAVSALLFLAIPRFQIENSMFLDRLISKRAKSGFSDMIRIGEVTDIQQDTSVALSVDVTDRTQIPAAPYWRMLVLDQYDNGTFKFSAGLRRELSGPRTSGVLRGEAKPRLGLPVYWTFYFESGVSRYLPLLGQFEELRFREAQNFRFAATLGVLELREEPVTMTAYRVEGFNTGPALPDPVFAQRWRNRERPATTYWTPQTRTLSSETDRVSLTRMMREAAGERVIPATEFAERVKTWLRQRHDYTLSPRIPAGDGDPLVRWMASREAGHCELFAGSFVLLARSAGFPARVVTGFRGGTWNAYSNNFTIRNSDAHAWAEIFDEVSGSWLRADPLEAPTNARADEARGEASLAARMDRSWSARLDSLRVFWYRRIVNFDQRSQADTMRALKTATEDSGRRARLALEDTLRRLKEWYSSPWDARRLAGLFGVVAMVAGLHWLWREFGRGYWRRWRTPRHGARVRDPIREEAGRWLTRLAEADEPGNPAAGAVPPAFTPVVQDLQRLRFGAWASWPAPERVFRAARQAHREARRRARMRV